MLRSMNQTGVVRTLAGVCLGFTSIVATAQLRDAQPPLHTSGHEILDTAGHRVRLTSVNWDGFDQQDFVAGGLDHAPLATIVKEIVDLGVNSVRLPCANETLECNPQVPDYAVPGHTVITALSRAWDRLNNGALLNATEEGALVPGVLPSISSKLS